jgi:glycosyltransferase involved in cell wall biosynthesis
MLMEIKKAFPENVVVISNEKNEGKAQSVRNGMLHCCSHFRFRYIAYLDADLSVSAEECTELTQHLNDEVVFCFGSRMAKVGSTIVRKRRRFLIGRVIATFISEILSLKVYDTQCGCKVFDAAIAAKLFEQPFISRWLFDVEIFSRFIGLYGRETAVTKMLEMPLVKWVDRGDSKVKITYFFKLWLDLYSIRKTYKPVLSRK